MSALYVKSGAAPLVAAPLETDPKITLTEGVLLKADDDNLGSIYVGSSAAVTADSGAPTSGFRLKAGQAVMLNVVSPTEVFIIASGANQNFVAVGASGSDALVVLPVP